MSRSFVMGEPGRASLATSRARIRGLAWLAAATLAAGFLSGCGDGMLTTRYRAQRDLWKASKLDRQLALQPSRDEALTRRTAEAYERILREYPAALGAGTSPEGPAVARVRGAAVMALVRLYTQLQTPRKAVDLLWTERGSFATDAESGVRVYSGLVQLLSRLGSPDSLALVYGEMPQVLPEADDSGNPVTPVLEAPMRQADVLATAGKEAEARAVLHSALDYYNRLIGDNAGKPIQVAAMVQRSSALTRLGRAQEAEAGLLEARGLPQAEVARGGILYSLGVLRQEALHRPQEAVAAFRELIRSYPEDDAAPQAALRIGLCLEAAGQPDSALASFDRVEELFGREPEVAAQARYLGAKTLARQGRNTEAARRLRSISADFPRTETGLRAPMDLAALYRQTDDRVSEQVALREATEEYERIVRELGADARQAEVIMSALDYLADSRLRLEEWQGAVEAMVRRADAFPGDARSPLALLQAAAIQETRLGDRAGSIATLQKLADRYPSHAMASRIQEKIATLKGAGT